MYSLGKYVPTLNTRSSIQMSLQQLMILRIQKLLQINFLKRVNNLNKTATNLGFRKKNKPCIKKRKMGLILLSWVYCTLQAIPFCFSHVILGMQELWHATAVKLVENICGTKSPHWIRNATECFTPHGVSILVQGNAIWYFRYSLGGVWGLLNVGQEGCEHGNLSLIKQSGLTN